MKSEAILAVPEAERKIEILKLSHVNLCEERGSVEVLMCFFFFFFLNLRILKGRR